MKRFMKTFHSLVIFSCLLLVASCSVDENEEMMIKEANASLNLEADEKKADNAIKTKYYTVDFGALNGSGVSGTAELALKGDELTVKVYATGLEPNLPHPQHIHGFMENKGNSTCPPSSADTNGDGLIDLVEGAPFYGPVLLELYEPIDVFPVADENGVIDFERTFTLGETEFEEEGQLISRADLTPLQNRTIVLHGMTVDGEYIATLPVACGEIKPAQGANNR